MGEARVCRCASGTASQRQECEAGSRARTREYLDLEMSEEDARLAYATEQKPDDVWTSPDCTAFTSIQRVNKARLGPRWRPAGE